MKKSLRKGGANHSPLSFFLIFFHILPCGFSPIAFPPPIQLSTDFPSLSFSQC